MSNLESMEKYSLTVQHLTLSFKKLIKHHLQPKDANIKWTDDVKTKRVQLIIKNGIKKYLAQEKYYEILTDIKELKSMFLPLLNYEEIHSPQVNYVINELYETIEEGNFKLDSLLSTPSLCNENSLKQLGSSSKPSDNLEMNDTEEKLESAPSKKERKQSRLSKLRSRSLRRSKSALSEKSLDANESDKEENMEESALFVVETAKHLHEKVLQIQTLLNNSVLRDDSHSPFEAKIIDILEERVNRLINDLQQNEAAPNGFQKLNVRIHDERGRPSELHCNVVSYIQSEKHLHCQLVNLYSLTSTPPFPQDLQLISNVLSFRYTNEFSDIPIMETPWKLVIPYPNRRIPGKIISVNVYYENDNLWKQIAFRDAKLDQEGLTPITQQIKSLEITLMSQLPMHVTISLKNRIEEFTLSKNGVTVTSQMDSRVSFYVPSNAIKVPILASLIVDPVDANVMKYIRRHHEIETQSLLSTSSIINIEFGSLKKSAKPLNIYFPVPYENEENEGPKITTLKSNTDSNTGETGLERRKSKKQGDVELTGFQKLFIPKPFMKNTRRDVVTILLREPESDKWIKWENVSFVELEEEMINISLDSTTSCKFMAFRTSSQVKDESLFYMKYLIDHYFYLTPVWLIFKHKHSNCEPQVCKLSITNGAKLDDCLAELKQKEFVEGEANPFELWLNEGEILNFQCRGNLQIVEDGQDYQISYHRFLDCQKEIVITKINPYAQISQETSYSGVLQIFAKRHPFNQKNKRFLHTVEKYLMTEIFVKKNRGKKKVINYENPQKFIFQNRSGISNELIELLVNNCDNAWENVVRHLGISETTFQTIKRRNYRNERKTVGMEILCHWVKSTKVSEDHMKHLLECVDRCEAISEEIKLRLRYQAKLNKLDTITSSGEITILNKSSNQNTRSIIEQ